MQRNIFIIGGQCAGKTTLVEALTKCHTLSHSAAGPPKVIHEIVRDLMSTKGFSSRDFGTPRWQELQVLTLETQYRAEESHGCQWFISDRSALDPVVYARMNTAPGSNLSGNNLRDTRAWHICRQRMRQSLVILCEAGNKSWLSADDVRLAYTSNEEWEALNALFEESLEEEGIPYHLLPKDMTCLDRRVEFVLARYVQ